MSFRKVILGALALVAAASSEAAIDFEGSVPAGWSESGGGSLSISSDHYRLGAESLQWDWQSGDVLTASGVSIDPGKVLDFYQHTCDLWIYSDTVTGGDALTIEFLDGSDAVQWRFDVQLNFVGWRHVLRSYKYDMENVGGGTDLQKVRFLAPNSGAGQLFLDDVEWVRSRLTRHRDRVMPDIAGYYSSTLFHDLDSLSSNVSTDPATGAELAALPQIEVDYWASAQGGDPGSGGVTTAKSTFSSWNIVRSGALIKGDPVDRDTIDDVDDFIGVLAREWHHDGDTQARDMAIDTVEHLLDQGWAGGSAESTDGGSSTYGTREVIRALLLLRDEFSPTTRAAVKDLLEWRLKKGFFWDPNIGIHKDTDYIHTESLGLMGLALGFADTDQEKVENLRGLTQYFEGFIGVTSGTANGIKPDGTSFHHWTHYNNYMYAYGQLADRLYVLRDSPFLVGQASYELFREACYVIGMMCNGEDYATGFCGRTPGAGLNISGSAYAKLAKAGGSFYGQTADPKIARFHNRVWGGDAVLIPYGAEAFPTGFWQFNYSPAGIYRTGNAVVSMKGLTDTFWGTEIYSNANRYGRYQGYGSVEVMYPGGRAASGMDFDGWDWNCPPGATTIQLPFGDLEAIAGRQDERAQTQMAGALSVDLVLDGEFGVKGRYGVFGMKFQQKAISATHNDTFTFRKSVFAFNGKLLCLGSDIANDDGVNETGTVLFQGALPTSSTPTTHQGADLTAFPLNSTWVNGSRWFLDHVGTGFYVNGDHVVKLARTNQSSPPQSGSGSNTTGDFAKAWISHGTSPAGEDYEYVILPDSDGVEMGQFAVEMGGGAPPYTVLQKNAAAHIVHLSEEDAHGYVCFDANAVIAHGPVTETSGSALVMTKRTGNYLVLSYANPELDLEFRVLDPAGSVTTDVRLAGEWVMDSGDPRAQLIPQGDGSTLLQFTTAQGLPVELGLISPVSFADWQMEHFTPAEIGDPLVSGPEADPDQDLLPNGIEYGLGGDPWVSVMSEPGYVVTSDGLSLDAVYVVDRSLSDLDLSLEQSVDLKVWMPLPVTLESDLLGIDTWRAVVPASGDQGFLRLKAELDLP